MQKSSPRLLDDELVDHIASLSPKEQSDWLYLTPHDQFAGRWFVDSLDDGYFYDFEDLIGQYRAVSPARVREFLDRAEDLKYKVAWTEDPAKIMSAWEHLSDSPGKLINSDLHHELYERGEVEAAQSVEATGMLPYQVQGFNFLRGTPRGGLALWSTGTGKSVLMTALTKWYLFIEKSFDLSLIVVKSNNKFDTQIKLAQLADIPSVLIDGYIPDKRYRAYLELADRLAEGPAVAVCNYEKLREDKEFFEETFSNWRVLIHWDEMPVKLSNRDSQLYTATRDAIYKPQGGRILWKNKRPLALRQYDYSATPIENAPDGLFNQLRLIDPELFPSISQWEKQHVVKYNRYNYKPEVFTNLELFGLTIEHITHQVDKEDPDIAKMFPKVREETIYVDWSKEDRSVYLKLQALAEAQMELAKEDPNAEVLTPIQLISVLQMICDAPSIVTASAYNREEWDRLVEEAIENDEDPDEIAVLGSKAAQTLIEAIGKPLTNDNSNKLKMLKELLTVKHPDDKSIIFTTWGPYGLPVLEQKLEEWGVSYTVYKGTDLQRQEAKDRFRNDPDIQVFLSSDAGSDSIDLPEARVVIHYNLPWSWAKLIQRQNRAHRVNSKHESVTFYMLMMADSIEFRKYEVIMKKLGYHTGIFKGSLGDEAVSMRMTYADFWYMLTGSYD